MSELRLGDPIGRVGGAQEPLEFVPDSPSTNFTVDLPDGEWAVSINFGTNNGGGTSSSGIRVNGSEVGNIRGSTGISPNSPLSIVLRHQTGTLQITSSNSGIPVRTVTAFPDPN
ncbi:hypothetical protein ACT3SZ_06520 [Corynebacterium sp. AOP40-9SA-29]|uniref:hypothetical protein n=1 Tax=Corynebacterium sp. AOP40-9SA-29 TaxID=3457677 RepID=UPI004034E6CC